MSLVKLTYLLVLGLVFLLTLLYAISIILRSVYDLFYKYKSQNSYLQKYIKLVKTKYRKLLCIVIILMIITE